MSTYAEGLVRRVANGELTEVIEFQGEFRWMSNFYCHYTKIYSVEQLFQAEKAVNDPVLRSKIMACEFPGEAKKLGRTATLPANWDEIKVSVMKKALMDKFTGSPMKDWLLATGEILITEGNYWHDQYWGNCLCGKCSSTRGINNLGILLMNIRSELREQALKDEECGCTRWYNKCVCGEEL